VITLTLLQAEFFSYDISDVIREGEAPVSINGKNSSTSNIGIYTIQDSDKNGFTIRCYNKNFGLSTPNARFTQTFLPNCE